MIIKSRDYHPSFQQIAFVDTETGDYGEQRLEHREEAEKFYRDLVAQGVSLQVGMEASGHARWLERLMAELNLELWIGDAAEIRSKRVRKQRADREDARLILRLLLEDRFPRIWVPSWENRDLRQHGHRMVQARTRIMHQLQAVTLIEGLRCKKRLWREKGRKQLEAFQLAPWASRRRRDLLELLDQLDPTIAELSQAIEQEVEKYPAAQRLMTHPGMGALTAPGLRADHRRGRAISVRQANGELSRTGAAGGFEWQSPTVGPYYQVGNSILRLLLVEAAQGAARSIPQWRSQYFHLTMRRGKKTAKVAMAQRLAARLYWMMRKKVGLPTSWEFPSHAEQPGNRHGVESNTE